MRLTVLLAVLTCCWIALTFVSYQYFLDNIRVTESHQHSQDVFDIHLIRNHKAEELPNVDPVLPVNRRTDAELLEEIYARRVEERKEANEIRFRNSCKNFTLEGEPEFEYTVHRNIFSSSSGSFKSTEITVISQCSDDRIDRAVKLLNRWPGPISLTIYMTQERTFNPSQFETFRRTNVFLHVALYKTGQPHYYPTNYMRNVALDNAPTELIFFVDIDFVPFFPSLYDSLVRWTKTGWLEPHKTALVVPSFSKYYKYMHIAETKKELVRFVEREEYRPFEIKSGGSKSTNYTRWYTATEPYSVPFTFYYEPYIVVRKTPSLPRFDRRFVGYGFNKNQYSLSLVARGYQFVVLPDVYVLHNGHKESDQFEARQSSGFCVDTVSRQFCSELAETVQVDTEIYNLLTERCQQIGKTKKERNRIGV